MATLQQARDFLARVVDWDGASYINLHYFVSKPNYAKRFMGGTAVKSVDGAVKQLIWIAGKKEIQDVYFCTSAQATCQDKQVGKLTIHQAVRNRDNVVSLKALFLDIDVGKEGGYATAAGAVAGLKKFILDTKLPAPTAIVASGTGGFHVYWIAEQPWQVTAWQRLADAMVAAVKASGLLCDTQCTVDAVRILRVPQTRNFKTDPPSPVVLKSLLSKDIPNAVLEQALEPFMEGLAPNPNKEELGEDEFSAGIQTGAAPRDINEVAAHCPWIKETLEQGGANNDNPRWFLSLRLALFCHDPDATGHQLSSGHPEYLAAETQQELDRLSRERENNPRIGFPSCKAISDAGALQCATCPLLQNGKSPLNAARACLPVVQGDFSITNPFMPDGYRLDAGGKIVKDITDEKGNVETKTAFPYVIHEPCVTRKPDGSWQVQFLTLRNSKVEHPVSIPYGAASSRDTLKRALYDELCPVKMDKLEEDFFVSFVERLREAAGGVADVMPYGWNFKGGNSSAYQGFTYAGKLYSPEGVSMAPTAEFSISSVYKVVGSDNMWKEAARLVNIQKRPALDCILAAAFAAPLVQLTGLQGICIGAVSTKSGYGKTTVMDISAAVWGNPLQAKQALNDTEVAVFAKAAQLVNLPLYWDELKTANDTDRFVNMIFQLSGGRDKARGNRSGGTREQKTFSTMLTYATNESLYEPMLRKTTGTDAGHLRMFEFEVKPIPEGQVNPLIGAVAAKLQQNHGHAGAVYAEYLGQHYKEVAEKVQSTNLKWGALVKASPSERFWVAACATLIVGANLANELGLTQFDEQGLRRFLYEEFMKKRAARNDSPNDLSRPEAVAAILGDFLAERAQEYTLITNQIVLTSGRPKPGAVKVEGEGTARLNRLKGVEVQYGRENGILRISDMALGHWLKLKGYPKGSFTSALCAVFGAKASYARLGSGTPYADPVTRHVWQISIPGSGLENMVEYDMPEPAPEVSNEEVATSELATA